MEDNVKVSNGKKLNKKVVFVALFIFLVLVPLTLYIFRDNIFKKAEDTKVQESSKITQIQNSSTYTIQNVSENFLDDYYDEKDTMVIFFASWCKYCVAEKDELNNFINNNKDKKIILVSHDDSYEALEIFLRDNNLTWTVILDTGKTIRNHIDPGTKGIPCAYLLDSKGKIKGYLKKQMTEQELLQFYNNEVGIY